MYFCFMRKEIVKPTLESISKEGIFKFMKKELFDYQFVTKDTGLSSRLINHWRSLGILIERERNFDQNYRFNFVELLWLKAIIAFRELGLPMEDLKKVKDILTEKHPITWYLSGSDNESADAKTKVENYIYENFIGSEVLRENFILSPSEISFLEQRFQFSQFELALFTFLGKRTSSQIHIFSNGNAICDYGENTNRNEVLLNLLQTKPHLTLPIFCLFNLFMEKEENFDFALKTEIINSIEGQILQYIRSGNFDWLKIEFKQGNPIYMEGNKKISLDAAGRIREYILSREYSKINISVASGNIQYAAKTIRVKL